MTFLTYSTSKEFLELCSSHEGTVHKLSLYLLERTNTAEHVPSSRHQHRTYSTCSYVLPTLMQFNKCSPTNRILSEVSPGVKVGMTQVLVGLWNSCGEHFGRNPVGRNRGGSMGIEWTSRLALSRAAAECEVAGEW
jgi:hypothetical protein